MISNAELQTRPASTRDQNAGRAQDAEENKDAPAAGAGERHRPPADAVGHLQGPTFVPDKRCKQDAPRVASVVGTDAVKERALRWNPILKPQVEASRSSAAGGVEGTVSARIAGACDRVSVQELSEGEGAAQEVVRGTVDGNMAWLRRWELVRWHRRIGTWRMSCVGRGTCGFGTWRRR